MKKILKIMPFLLVLTMLFSSCSGAGSKTTAGGKTLYLRADAALNTMDSCLATDGGSMMAIMYTNEGLYHYDKTGKVVLGLAKSVDVSADKFTYTFHLKDAKWSNGDTITAKDFEFAWKRLANPKTGAEYGYFLLIAGVKNAAGVISGKSPVDDLGVKATDDKTLVVTLDQAVPYLSSLLAGSYFSPIDEKFYDQHGDKYGLTAETILSSGPYYISKWEVGGNHYTLTKNPKYYDADKIPLGAIDFTLVQDSQQAVMSYETGKLDSINLTGDQVDQYKTKKEYHQNQIGMLWFISPNTKVEGLNNSDLRNAIALAINKKAIVDNILKDGSVVANFAIPKGFAMGPDGKYFRDTADEYQKTDLAKAKTYFEKAKQELGKDKFTFEFLYESDTPSCAQIAQYIQSQLQSELPGITINLKVTTKKNRVELMDKGQYQLGLTRWGGDYQDPTAYLTMWETGNSYNNGSYSNTTYDSLVSSCVNGDLAAKPAERWSALKKAESIIMNEAGIIPLYQMGTATLIKSDVTNLVYVPSMTYLWQYASKK